MKRVLAIALGLAVMASASYAQTNQVLSRNAVGYVKINVPPKGNGFNLTRLDFIGLGSSVTVSNMLGSQLPDGSQIIFYKNGAYKFLTRARGSWPEGTTVVDTATGFFLVGQTNVGQTSYPVFLMGEVPDRFTQPTNTEVVGDPGPATKFQLLGFPYPVSRPWSNVALTATLSNNAQIILFDGSNYTFFTKARGSFSPTLLTNFVVPGQGFFVSNTQVVNWVEAKPYTWP